MKKLLFFIEDENEPRRKTRVYNVYSGHSNDFLGKIHWRSGWRCYVMSYNEDIDMSLSCNKELNEFMQKLEDERRKSNERL
jgi:hypothetical protein